MYDQAKAAYQRILTAAGSAGEVGQMYVRLADALMALGESEQKKAAIKRLADSCETAVAALTKDRQPQRNRFSNVRSSEKPSS